MITSKLFDGRPLAVLSEKTIEDFQAHNIQCHHCKKTYAAIADFNNIKILDSGPHMVAAVSQGLHSRFTVRFQCQCKAIVTVMAPLSSQGEFEEVVGEIQRMLKK